MNNTSDQFVEHLAQLLNKQVIIETKHHSSCLTQTGDSVRDSVMDSQCFNVNYWDRELDHLSDRLI